MKKAPVCVVLLVLAGCFSGHADAPEPNEIRVRRGPFTNEVVLSGELEAARGDSLAVPPLPNWQTAIKWMAEDGATVKAGDPVAELDNSALTADLEQKRQTAMQAAQELRQREGEWEADLEQKQLEVDKKKSDVEKTRLQTLVPKELQSVRQFEQNELAFKKANIEHEKALDVLRSRRTAVAAERENVLLRIAQAERDIAAPRLGINALVLRAPKDGIVVIRDHWQGRKLQIGDTVFVGFPIAMLPDLSSIRLKAALADVDDGKIADGHAGGRHPRRLSGRELHGPHLVDLRGGAGKPPAVAAASLRRVHRPRSSRRRADASGTLRPRDRAPRIASECAARVAGRARFLRKNAARTDRER